MPGGVGDGEHRNPERPQYDAGDEDEPDSEPVGPPPNGWGQQATDEQRPSIPGR